MFSYLFCIVYCASLASFLQGADITTSCEQKYVDQVQGKVTCVLDKTELATKCTLSQPTTVTFKFQANGQTVNEWCSTSYSACTPGAPKAVCNGCTCGCEDASNPTGPNYTLTFTPDMLTHNLGRFECEIDCGVLSTNPSKDHSSCSAIAVGLPSLPEKKCELTSAEIAVIFIVIILVIGIVAVVVIVVCTWKKNDDLTKKEDDSTKKEDDRAKNKCWLLKIFAVVVCVIIVLLTIIGIIIYTVVCEYDEPGWIVGIVLAALVSIIVVIIVFYIRCCKKKCRKTGGTVPPGECSRSIRDTKKNDNAGGDGRQGTSAAYGGSDSDNNGPPRKKKTTRKPAEDTTEMTGLNETSSPSDEEPGKRVLPIPARLPPLSSSGGLTSVERNSYAESQSRQLPFPAISPRNKE